MRVAVNSGHHIKYDSGAVGAYSREADIVKYVSEVVCKDLEAVGIETLFIMEDELQDICDKANDFKADLFISIHCNSAVNSEAEGTECFYWEAYDESYKLADCIQNQLLDTMDSVDRGLKDGSWLYVLKYTDMTAVLVELDFISNPDREKYLNENKKAMAHAIARGVTDYLSNN